MKHSNIDVGNDASHCSWPKTSTSTRGATIGSLPAETLQTIFEYSEEPSLIHTSAKLWHTLPDYQEYTKRLTLIAMVPLEDARFYFPSSRNSKAATMLIRLSRTTSLHEQQVVRQRVFWGSWFNDCHFEKTHQCLLRWRVHQVYSRYTGRPLPKSHQRRLDVHIKRLYRRHFLSEMNIVLLKGELDLYVGGFEVTVVGRDGSEMQSIKALDFGKTVPDRILRPPLTLTRLLQLREIAAPKEPMANISSSIKVMQCMLVNSVPQDQQKGVDFLAVARQLRFEDGQLELSEMAKNQPWARGITIILDDIAKQTKRYDTRWLVFAVKHYSLPLSLTYL